MNAQEVILSIITPVYNSEKFIDSCIQNVISQNCDFIEHIIIDGNSSDGTVSAIKKYAEQYSHIKWVSEDDLGQSDAMNKGIELAQGDYIGFLNVDDRYEAGTLTEVSKLICEPSPPDFIVGNCKVWDENEELIYINRPNKLKPWHILSNYYLPVNPSAYFYRKKLHEKTGRYNIENHYNMDIEFLVQASMVTDMLYIPKDWGNFYLHKATKTFNDNLVGSMVARKLALYKKVLANTTFKIKVLTYLTIFSRQTMLKYRRLKKKIMWPFDVIYWKTSKTLKSLNK